MVLGYMVEAWPLGADLTVQPAETLSSPVSQGYHLLEVWGGGGGGGGGGGWEGPVARVQNQEPRPERRAVIVAAKLLPKTERKRRSPPACGAALV